MARGLHRYAEMELRYGNMRGEKFRPFRTITSSGDVSLPRGDFRISVVGAGGGGSFYQSNSNQNTSGHFTGYFGVACGGRGGVVVFDVHIPANGIIANCTIGAGGKGKTGTAAEAGGPAAAGGPSKIVISDLSITVQANGGAAGIASSSVTSCKPGAGGDTSYSGITPILNVSKAAAYVEEYDATMDLLLGRNFASKLDYHHDSAPIDRITSAFTDNETVDEQLLNVSPESEISLLSLSGNGGTGELAVAYNSDTDKYKVLGYEVDGWTQCGQTSAGDNGIIAIERL